MEIDYVRVYKPADAGPFTVTTHTDGAGTVARGANPGNHTYALNEPLSLTAVPAVGYAFRGWHGDLVSTQNPLSLHVVRDLNLIAHFAPQKALIGNGAFTHNAHGWNRLQLRPGKAAATGTARHGAYHVDIMFGGLHDDDIQLRHAGIPFVQGKTYQLTFDARSDAKRTIKAVIHRSGVPEKTYHSQTFAITPHNQTYRFAFPMVEPTDANASVVFNLGVYDHNDVYLDNITFIEISRSTSLKTDSGGHRR